MPIQNNTGANVTRLDWQKNGLINHADPYLLWADIRGNFPTDLEKISALVELESDQTIDGLRATALQSDGLFEVSKLYPCKVNDTAHRYCTILAKFVFFERLSEFKIKRYAIGWARIPLANKATPVVIATELVPHPPPVLAVIDDGLPYLHSAFRSQDGKKALTTRVLRFRDLGEQTKSAELKQIEIARQLKSDERSVYASDGYKRVLPEQTHGSHLMDTVAGKSRVDAASSMRIIAVQLPERTVIDSSGGSLAVHAVDAFRYVLNVVDEKQPVVACMSYGVHAGPHDGSSLFEEAVDELLKSRPKSALVLPAGNNYLAQGHIRASVVVGAQHDVYWRILPDDCTDSFCEVWFDTFGSDSESAPFELTLSPPTGIAVVINKVGFVSITDTQGSGVSLACVVLKCSDNNGKQQRWCATLCVGSTKGGLPAPHGAWKIQIVNKHLSKEISFDAWIERDGAVFGGDSGGKQSYFEDTSGSGLTSTGTLNGIATGEETIVAGACVEKTGSISSYSAAGADYFSGPKKNPSWSATGDQEEDAQGIEGAGTRGNLTFKLSGTSVAAACLTRIIANEWAKDPKLDRNAIKNKITNKAFIIGQSPDPYRLGSGFVKR